MPRLATRPASALADRLAALDELVALADGRLDPQAVGTAARLAAKAGTRLRLGDRNTVVALAGATGSGKSSLFNALLGEPVAAVGVRRPTTSAAQAGGWGVDGAQPLLDWLEVPRRHLLGAAEDDPLAGLVLLDLPDVDSVRGNHRLEVDRLVELVDLLVWVLDPQKYADGVVHDRYLRPLAQHAGVMLVVLNQIDLLDDPAPILADLRGLLGREGLDEVPVLPVSATTGEGMPELRRLLADRVAAHRAAERRLDADLRAVADAMAAGRAPGRVGAAADADHATAYRDPAGRTGDVAAGRHGSVPRAAAGGGTGGSADVATGRPGGGPRAAAGGGTGGSAAAADRAGGGGRRGRRRRAEVRREDRAALVDALTDAAGAETVVAAVERSHRMRARSATGWPFTRWLAKVRPDPMRRLRLPETPSEAIRTGLPGPSAVQRARVDTALRALAGHASADLPDPWPALVRHAAAGPARRDRADDLPDALDRAVAGTDLDIGRQPRWWMLARFVQALLAVAGIAGALWLAVLVGLSWLQLPEPPLPHVGRVPLPTVLLVAGLGLGLLLALLSRRLAATGARRRGRTARRRLRERVERLAEERVLAPVERELDAYRSLGELIDRVRG